MGMTGLYIGVSALMTNSNALNTTANNLSNVNTKGYVRQQVVDRDITYNSIRNFATNTAQQGLGVSIQEVRHVRDILVDKAYRKESGRQNFYDKMWDSVQEIESLMGEMDGVSYQNSINELMTAINEVAKTPDENVARASLVQSAVTFLDRSQSIYNGMKTYQANLDSEVKSTVKRINQIGASIVELNREIGKIETTVEHASTLKDERDLLIDELAQYGKIDYKEDDYGVCTITFEGSFFCDNKSYSPMDIVYDTVGGFITPVWSMLDDMPVYTMQNTISTEKNTDIGGLKGLLAARGTSAATFDARGTAEFQESSQYSILVRTMANFDTLVNSIVTSINDVLCPMSETEASFTYTDENGAVVTYNGPVYDKEKAGIGKDAAQTVGAELFSRKYTERYKMVTADDGTEYLIPNDTNSFGNPSSYTVMNLEVNPAVLQDYAIIPLNTPDGQVDYDKAKALVDCFSERNLTYEGGLEALSFEQFYEEMISDVGNTGQIYKSMTESEETLTNSLDNQRQSVMSVSSDEELTNLIKFQQGYNAASRYINVVSSMMETIINTMGV